jgi:hypothetical protein
VHILKQFAWGSFTSLLLLASCMSAPSMPISRPLKGSLRVQIVGKNIPYELADQQVYAIVQNEAGETSDVTVATLARVEEPTPSADFEVNFPSVVNPSTKYTVYFYFKLKGATSTECIGDSTQEKAYKFEGTSEASGTWRIDFDYTTWQAAPANCEAWKS